MLGTSGTRNWGGGRVGVKCYVSCSCLIEKITKILPFPPTPSTSLTHTSSLLISQLPPPPSQLSREICKTGFLSSADGNLASYFRIRKLFKYGVVASRGPLSLKRIQLQQTSSTNFHFQLRPFFQNSQIGTKFLTKLVKSIFRMAIFSHAG